MDFAWFVVHFNYSRAEYDALTLTEKAFIRKAYEDKTVSDTTLIRNAVLNAVANANRKKGKRFRELWRKKMPVVNKNDKKKKFSSIEEIEKREVGWIKKIYAANAGKITKKK